MGVTEGGTGCGWEGGEVAQRAVEGCARGRRASKGGGAGAGIATER